MVIRCPNQLLKRRAFGKPFRRVPAPPPKMARRKWKVGLMTCKMRHKCLQVQHSFWNHHILYLWALDFFRGKARVLLSGLEIILSKLFLNDSNYNT